MQVCTAVLALAVLHVGRCVAVPISPAEMQKRMGLGINLGNRLDLYDQPVRPVNQTFFSAFVQQGFTNARVPVCWDLHVVRECAEMLRVLEGLASLVLSLTLCIG